MPISTAEGTLVSALGGLESAYVREVGAYVDRVRPYWSEKLGSGGTLTNLESGLGWMVTLGNISLESGCVEMQAATYAVLTRFKPSGWQVKRIMIGAVFEHHAVVVYQDSLTYKDGYFFDPWMYQKPLIFTYKEWIGRFPHYRVFKEEGLE